MSIFQCVLFSFVYLLLLEVQFVYGALKNIVELSMEVLYLFGRILLWVGLIFCVMENESKVKNFRHFTAR